VVKYVCLDRVVAHNLNHRMRAHAYQKMLLITTQQLDMYVAISVLPFVVPNIALPSFAMPFVHKHPQPQQNVRFSNKTYSRGGRRAKSMICQDFSCVEFNKHCPVSFHLFKWYRKSEVVQEQKLQFQMIEFWER
jgi:hypothetical protein